MRCMACGAEMRLMQVVPDDTMMVAGYEHHTLQCTGCDEVERRLVFNREKTPVDSVPAPPTRRVAPETKAQETGAKASALPLRAPGRARLRCFAAGQWTKARKGSVPGCEATKAPLQ
jgi:hypothetical protein